MTPNKPKKRAETMCVMKSPEGELLYWFNGHNREECWDNYLYYRDTASLIQAKKEGYRCVKVQIKEI